MNQAAQIQGPAESSPVPLEAAPPAPTRLRAALRLSLFWRGYRDYRAGRFGAYSGPADVSPASEIHPV